MQYCILPYHSGTPNSIWANGSLPSSAGNYRTLTACVRNKESCCSEQWPIRVRKCSLNDTEFILYKLPPSPRCPMAYCAGKLLTVVLYKHFLQFYGLNFSVHTSYYDSYDNSEAAQTSSCFHTILFMHPGMRDLAYIFKIL